MRKIVYLTISFIALILLIFLYNLQSLKKPIKIGLTVTLTGKSPELGREIRDGVFLAVDEINKSGGINGKKILCIIKDNRGDSEIAELNVTELIQDEVVAIIGPDTSTIAKVILPIINKNKILTISPTVSATDFFIKDDYFVILEPSNREFGNTLAKYLNENLINKKILILQDDRNPVYTADFVGNFVNGLDKKIKVNSTSIKRSINDFDRFVSEILKDKPEVIVIVTDVIYASILTQKIRDNNEKIKIIICPWAKFNSFINYAGPKAEGVLSIGYSDISKNREAFKKFEEKFINTYGYSPEFPSINAYNAVMILRETLLREDNVQELNKRIIDSKFILPFSHISIDKYGDAIRETFIVEIKNGKYQRIIE